MAQGIPLALVAAGTCFVLWNASWAMQAGSGSGGGGGEGGSEKNTGTKVQARQLSTFQAGVPDEVYGTLEWTHWQAEWLRAPTFETNAGCCCSACSVVRDYEQS